MNKIKKININFYISALIILAITLFILLSIAIINILYSYNSSNEYKVSIEKYIKANPLKNLQIEDAHLIIEYNQEGATINPQQTPNPFRIFEDLSETE